MLEKNYGQCNVACLAQGLADAQCSKCARSSAGQSMGKPTIRVRAVGGVAEGSCCFWKEKARSGVPCTGQRRRHGLPWRAGTAEPPLQGVQPSLPLPGLHPGTPLPLVTWASAALADVRKGVRKEFLKDQRWSKLFS